MVEYQTISPGSIIVSTPSTDKGIIFNKSVIMIISHDKRGTSGIIVNKLLNVLHGEEIGKSLYLPTDDKKEESITIEDNANLPVFFGGPVEQDRGIILHSGDYKFSSSVKVTDDVCISTSSEIINDILSNNGPKNKMLVLGYASWVPNQLASEIKRNDWLLVLDEKIKENPKLVSELIFQEDNIYKWNLALKMSGVNQLSYPNFIGNA